MGTTLELLSTRLNPTMAPELSRDLTLSTFLMVVSRLSPTTPTTTMVLSPTSPTRAPLPTPRLSQLPAPWPTPLWLPTPLSWPTPLLWPTPQSSPHCHWISQPCGGNL